METFHATRTDQRSLANATKTNLSVDNAALISRYGGKALLFAGIITTAYNIATADNKARAVAQEAGGWTGAWAGGEAGAAFGATVGSVFGGIGAAPGAVIGGVIGAIGGGIAGSQAGDNLYSIWCHLNSE